MLIYDALKCKKSTQTWFSKTRISSCITLAFLRTTSGICCLLTSLGASKTFGFVGPYEKKKFNVPINKTKNFNLLATPDASRSRTPAAWTKDWWNKTIRSRSSQNRHFARQNDRACSCTPSPVFGTYSKLAKINVLIKTVTIRLCSAYSTRRSPSKRENLRDGKSRKPTCPTCLGADSRNSWRRRRPRGWTCKTPCASSQIFSIFFFRRALQIFLTFISSRSISNGLTFVRRIDWHGRYH